MTDSDAFDRIDMELWALLYARDYATGRSNRTQKDTDLCFESTTSWILDGPDAARILRYRVMRANADHKGSQVNISMLLQICEEDFKLIQERLFPPTPKPDKPKAPAKKKSKKKSAKQVAPSKESATDK
jgi:hypothetical protein